MAGGFDPLDPGMKWFVFEKTRPRVMGVGVGGAMIRDREKIFKGIYLINGERYTNGYY